METRPNILLLLTDQQRFDTIQALGSKFAAQTPAMDSLVRDGVSFDSAFCTAPVCSPSRATLLTGLYPSQAGVPSLVGGGSPPLSPSLMTVGKRLRQVGYETAYHGKWHLGGDIHEHGFDTAEECSLDEVTRLKATAYWKNRDWVYNADRPFFHIVSFLNPHDHYFYDTRDRIADFKRPWPKDDEKPLSAPAMRRADDWEEERWGAYFRFYESLIERVDRDIAETLHQFRCSGFFSNSWIIFSADHGDMAGEHNLPFKGPFMYDGVTRVPLVIVPPRHAFSGPGIHQVPDPGITPGRRKHLASLADIVPTILDLAGVAPSPDLPGRSLLPIIRDASAPPVREYTFAEWAQPAARMCRSLDWKYVLYLNGEEQLFDLKADPNELHNLAAAPAHAANKKNLRAELEAHLHRTGDPFHSLHQH